MVRAVDGVSFEIFAGETSTAKVADRVTPTYRRMVEASPFVVVATSGPGGIDCTPVTVPIPPGQCVTTTCGSGVTACHNLIVLEHAGLGPGRLYDGSWSQWSNDPDRPAASGP